MIDEFTRHRIQGMNTNLTLEQVIEKLKDCALAAESAGKTVKFLGIAIFDPEGDSEVNAARYGLDSVAETLGFLELLKSDVVQLFTKSRRA